MVCTACAARLSAGPQGTFCKNFFSQNFFSKSLKLFRKFNKFVSKLQKLRKYQPAMIAFLRKSRLKTSNPASHLDGCAVLLGNTYTK